ncbi:MAG: MBL fold metallo-hydrolase [Gemmatimonadaceae bacterium]
MKIDILGSGSRGNALVIDGEDNSGAVLIDCGFGPRILAGRMKHVGVRPQDVSTVVVTHEHHDHVRGVRQAIRRWKWEVAATEGTARCAGLKTALKYQLSSGRKVRLAGLTIETLRTPHDAAESVGVIVTHERSGARIGVVYDLGHWTPSIAARLRGLDALVLEANHDEEMLQAGPYPIFLKERVAGSKGHLCNADAANLARSVAHRGLTTIVLAHLSEENNLPHLALATVRQGLRGTGFRGTLHVALQNEALHFELGPSRRTRQLSFDL